MEKLDPKADGSSKDIVQENIEKLKTIFPEIFSENMVDFTKLKETLGEYVEEQEERYNFTWYGKSQARRMAQTPSTGTLRPCKEESKDWDTTQNLFIEGDNLEVLKLLQKTYHKKVKMIYIDPPYNTGKEFIYPDNYRDNLDTYLAYTGQKDTEGYKFSSNAEQSGRYHTNWLSMMYPRLKLARNLLKDNGVIFISIDDNEVSNLRKICDEIYGEDNFVATIVWKHTQQSKNDERYFSRHYNSLIVYRKSELIKEFRFPRTAENNRNYSNPDNDPNGDWRSGDVRSPNYRNTLCYDIATPSGGTISHPEKGWRWSPETLQGKIKTGEIIFNEDETKITRKIYLKNQKGRTPENLWQGEEFGTTRIANTEIKQLFDNKTVFDTPKPSVLIKKITQLFFEEKDYIVMDFFAGSCPTAQAIIKQNQEDNGSRKYIIVQLPEICDEKSTAFKAGYKTIADIGKERIRRAGDKILEENKDKEGIENLDTGFKVFKLDSSNIKAWDADFDNLQQSLIDAVHNIKEDRTEEDVLYELLLKYGLDLTLPIEERTIAGKTVYSIGFGALVICLDSEITLEVVEGIGKLKDELEPEIMRVVFKDSGFKDDVVKTNAIQILKRYDITDVKSL